MGFLRQPTLQSLKENGCSTRTSSSFLPAKLTRKESTEPSQNARKVKVAQGPSHFIWECRTSKPRISGQFAFWRSGSVVPFQGSQWARDNSGRLAFRCSLVSGMGIRFLDSFRVTPFGGGSLHADGEGSVRHPDDSDL